MRRKQFLSFTAASLLILGLGHLALTSPEPLSSLSDSEFEQLSLSLSEPGGFFGTDNLVSNESSFLHVKEDLTGNVTPGQVYLGVGPDQNFSYIGLTRPSLAFILDIRRDNLLHQIYLKAIFSRSRDRWDYLSQLFGKPIRAENDRDPSAGAEQLVSYFNTVPANAEYFESRFELFWSDLKGRFPELLEDEDRGRLLKIASAFFRNGLSVRYEIPGRPQLSFFPSFGDLMRESDLQGLPGHYLHSEDTFQFLKRMQESNRVVPVVGDFAGEKALKAIGNEIRRREMKVTVFYLSNVEFYLFRSGTFERFVDNVRSLPVEPNGLLIRSYFNNWFGTWRTHPHAVPRYFSTSLTQYVRRFLRHEEVAPYANYWDMVTRDYIGAPASPIESITP